MTPSILPIVIDFGIISIEISGLMFVAYDKVASYYNVPGGLHVLGVLLMLYNDIQVLCDLTLMMRWRCPFFYLPSRLYSTPVYYQ